MTAMLTMNDLSKKKEDGPSAAPEGEEKEHSEAEEMDAAAKQVAADAARVTAMLTRREFGIEEPKKPDSKPADPEPEEPSIDEANASSDAENRSREEIVKATAFLARKRFQEAAEKKESEDGDASESKQQD